MARKKIGKIEARWRQILERQPGSGLSVRQFCAGEGISEPSFYAWRKRLRTRMLNGPETVRNQGRGEEVSDNAQLFVPVRLIDSAATLEILHPLGYRIQVTGDVSLVALRRVIETLDERAAR